MKSDIDEKMSRVAHLIWWENKVSEKIYEIMACLKAKWNLAIYFVKINNNEMFKVTLWKGMKKQREKANLNMMWKSYVVHMNLENRAKNNFRKPSNVLELTKTFSITFENIATGSQIIVTWLTRTCYWMRKTKLWIIYITWDFQCLIGLEI